MRRITKEIEYRGVRGMLAHLEQDFDKHAFEHNM
jgi:hypothetical protein